MGAESFFAEKCAESVRFLSDGCRDFSETFLCHIENEIRDR